MAYLVNLTSRASRDLQALFELKHASDAVAAGRWFDGLEKAVFTLEDHPRRCPAAPEGRHAGRPLRNLLYGKKPHVYRVIYEIDERQQVVQVLAIRHGAREPIAEI